MLARELVLQSLLELTTDAPSLTPLELGDRVLAIALAIVDCEAVALLTPRKDALRIVRRRDAAACETIPAGRDGSGFLRLVTRRAHPFVTPDFSAETRLTERDACPGVESGPAVFVPFGSRDSSRGHLAAYRAKGGAPFDADDARLLTLLATSTALALENRRLAQDLHRLAVTDDLTQVYNYRFLKTALRRELKRAARFGQQLSVVMIDVDNLKMYNDVNGHLRGSLLLKDLAGLCAEQVRSFDVLAKYGGDEFTIILPQTDQDGACVVAERVRAAVEEHAFALSQAGGITVSLGVATFPADGIDSTGLLQAADRALYRAKRAGRNRLERSGPLAA
jgi:diguanylate cyclase (GGDEF)-like protein